MKGKNTLRLNISTMHEAAQMWVDSALTAKPRVIAVRQVQPVGYGDNMQPMFYEIDVDDSIKVADPHDAAGEGSK